MKPERRGLVLVIAVILISAVLGGIYWPQRGRFLFGLEDELIPAIRAVCTNVLDVVQANYAEPVDVDKAVYQGAIPGMLYAYWTPIRISRCSCLGCSAASSAESITAWA